MSFIGTRPRLNIVVFPTYIAQNESGESYKYFDLKKKKKKSLGVGKLPIRYLKKVTIFNA